VATNDLFLIKMASKIVMPVHGDDYDQVYINGVLNGESGDGPGMATDYVQIYIPISMGLNGESKENGDRPRPISRLMGFEW
jgi:hypothetical protein